VRKRVDLFAALFLSLSFALYPASALGMESVPNPDLGNYGQLAYEYLQQIDCNYFYRYCTDDKQSEAIQEWIVTELAEDGYADGQIDSYDFIFTSKKGDYLSENITVTLPGRSEQNIIIGAHYDGGGTGDNGSGVALLLETAHDLAQAEDLPYTIVLAFFGAEEVGMCGSEAYVKNLTEEETTDIRFYLNIDSITSGDYCYLYGGVADMENRCVNRLEVFNLFYETGRRLGLDIHTSPWTFDHPAPGTDTPRYPSPTAGSWGDFVDFSDAGIPYVYFEASNWEVPNASGSYDERIETAEFGNILHTDKDSLAFIQEYFPGRILEHLQVYSLLLHTVLNEL
jgi:alkaline phosphatase isozyme conversion protein